MKKWTNEGVTRGLALALCMLMLFIGVVALAKSAAFAEAATPGEPSATDEPKESESPAPTETPEATAEPENTPSPDPTAAPPEDTPDATATPQPTPPAQAGSYSIQIDPPNGWFSRSAEVHVKVTDMNGAGLSRLRILFATGSAWDTLVDSAENASDYTLTLRENGTIYVEITDKLGNVQARSTAITCFDHDAPSVRASVSGDILFIDSSDALSGVACVYVNSHKLSQSNNGTLDAKIADYADGKEYVEIYAEDKAGNRSEIVRVKNPLYDKKADDSGNTSSGGTSGGESTAKPSATKKPSSKKTTNTATATPTPEVTATPEPTITPLPTCTPLPTATLPSFPSIPSVGIPFISDGNMQTLDMLYSQATNKQFISIQTKSGETYYLVIDYDKPIDEDGDQYETYFLNLVDDRDLLAVLADDEKPTPEPTAEPTPTPTPLPLATPDPDADDSSDMTKMVSAILLILILIGGAAIVVVMLKKKDSGTQMPSFDEDDDEDDDEDESGKSGNDSET